MNRSPWKLVWLTVIIMVGVTLCTAMPWRTIVPPITGAAARATSRIWSAESERFQHWIDARRFEWALARVAAPESPSSVIPVAAMTVPALAAVASLIAWRRRRRRPRSMVLRLAGAGAPLSRIASHVGLPQDAVQLLLSPMLEPGREGGRRTGKSFRNRTAAAAGSRRGSRQRLKLS